MSDFGCVDLLCQMAAFFFIPTMVLTASKFCWILPEESAHNECRDATSIHIQSPNINILTCFQ